jgi:hypothetical protein
LWLPALLGPPALASFSANYTADGTYPENQGWTRRTAYGGAVRSFDDGALVLDSRASYGIMDYYHIERPGAIHLDPGETWVMEWRLKVTYMSPPSSADVGTYVFSDDSWALAFDFTADRVYSGFEYPTYALVEPGVWHSYRAVSPDLRTYTLFVDGAPALQGFFVHVFTASETGWGDGTQGPTSVSEWADVHFETVPEPTSVLCALLGLGAILRGRCNFG